MNCIRQRTVRMISQPTWTNDSLLLGCTIYTCYAGSREIELSLFQCFDSGSEGGEVSFKQWWIILKYCIYESALSLWIACFKIQLLPAGHILTCFQSAATWKEIPSMSNVTCKCWPCVIVSLVFFLNYPNYRTVERIQIHSMFRSLIML